MELFFDNVLENPPVDEERLSEVDGPVYLCLLGSILVLEIPVPFEFLCRFLIPSAARHERRMHERKMGSLRWVTEGISAEGDAGSDCVYDHADVWQIISRGRTKICWKGLVDVWEQGWARSTYCFPSRDGSRLRSNYKTYLRDPATTDPDGPGRLSIGAAAAYAV